MLRKRGADLTKYTTLKREAMTAADKGATVNTSRAIKQIDEEIAKLDALGDSPTTAVASAISTLKSFRSMVENKTLTQIEDVRKLLGDELRAPELASARSLIEKIPSRVYAKLNDDIGDTIKSVAGQRDFNRWKIANTRLAQMAGEAENTKLRFVLNEGKDTPEVVNRLLFSANKSDVERLYKNLTPTGRANARTAIIQRAIEKSGGVDEISPDKFITQMDRLQTQTGVMFNSEQRQQLKGLQVALNATRRAQGAAVLTNSGQEAAAPVAGIALGSLFGVPGAIAAGAGIGFAARIYESKPVRDALMRVAAAKSPADQSRAIALLAPVIQQQQQQAERQREAQSKQREKAF
ncbi:MAG: hypothetical protein ACRCV9_17255 [Burkholderiaceae bacterium]